MRTRTFIAGLIALPINAVLFGTGAITVVWIPALAEHAKYLLPAVVVGGFVAAAPLAWMLAKAAGRSALFRSREHCLMPGLLGTSTRPTPTYDTQSLE